MVQQTAIAASGKGEDENKRPEVIACPASWMGELREYLREIPVSAVNCVHDAECLACVLFQESEFVKVVEDSLVIGVKLANHL